MRTTDLSETLRLRGLYLDALKLALTNVYYEGRPAPHSALDIAGLSHLQNVLEMLLSSGVPGDLLSLGHEPAGVGIWLSALLDAHGDSTRRLWLLAADKASPLLPEGDLSPTERLFLRYGLLDPRLKLLPDRDAASLATVSARLALLRLGPGLVAEAAELLVLLYPRLSPGACILSEPEFQPPVPLQALGPGRWQKPDTDATLSSAKSDR